METKNFICICCPMGCHLTVTLEEGAVQKMEGNSCGRGIAYARQEATNPTRMVTALMRAANREQPLSVKTTAPVPKNLIFCCVNEIYAARPKAPIHLGEVLIENVCGTGANVVATQDMP